jgi:AcrR family transcriptional regulator
LDVPKIRINPEIARDGARGASSRDPRSAVASAPRVRRRTQDERSSATREALLEAAMWMFAKDGYAATTTREIAQRAGVSRGALQYHFTSWSELVTAVFEYFEREMGRRFVFDRTIGSKGLEERVDHVVETYHRLLTSPFRRAALNIWLGISADRELRPLIRKRMRDSLAAGDRALSRIFADVRIDRDDFRSLRRIVMMAVAGYAVSEGIEPDASWVRDSGLVKDIFLRRLRPRDPADAGAATAAQ